MPTPGRSTIPADIHDAMVAHCLREAPLECCGLLGGVAPRVSSFHPLRNAAASETRYDADPHDLIEAVVDLRERGAEILAIYHSHPRWEAVPSQTDLRENHYGPVPRIIVSLLGADARRPRLAARPRLVRGTPLADRRADEPAVPLNPRRRPAKLPLSISEDRTAAKDFGRRHDLSREGPILHAAHPDHLQARLRPAPAGRRRSSSGSRPRACGSPPSS